MPLDQNSQIGPIAGFLSPSLTATDPSIPYLPLESPPVSADPPFRSRAQSIMAGIVAAWSIVTVAPLWAAVLLQPVPVDAPPAGHEARTAEVQAQVVETWTPPPHESQRRPSLPQESVAVPDKVPFTDAAHFPISQWPQPSWETQRRGRLTVSVDLPVPLHAAKHLAQAPVWQWPPSDWPAQSAKPLPQALSLSVSLPVSAASTQQRVIQSHYAAPTVQPLWASVLLQAEVVDQPPIGHPSRARAAQSQYHESWVPFGYELPSRRLLPQAGAVIESVPGVTTAHFPISQWHAPTWEAQRRSFLPQGAATADAPVPRVSSALLPMRHWSESAWEVPARRVLVQPAAVAQVPSSRTNQLPIALTPALTWGTQTRPRLIVSVDPPPVVSRRPTLQLIVSQWEAAANALPRRLTLPSSVDAPPSLSRASHAIMSQWEPLTWPAQDRARLTVQSLALSSIHSIRVTDLSGSLASCAEVVGALPTATQVAGAMPTGVEVTGALSTASGVTGMLPTATDITGVL